ncbi:uncharacterized protein MYCFIDRAFT_87859 [Pseudocercospora fijiensis CIRAD86]|uniref:Uncharacterized protein n=1 Tax=Pseudocercospora fijiensis (strain CIRAD86) TaxID=383855 RepID=M3A5N2_PSEFD|nr:uncharacterized protein MYCFIDRAFT_87859 [Pseudocercospora fijiensis CIRAD86]EME79931.1 hypothetical protein MYCFIDRAFT_87859 [Pseudocercospora fijiensis CIRAD86]
MHGNMSKQDFDSTQLGAMADERLRSAFPDEDMTAGGRLERFHLIEECKERPAPKPKPQKRETPVTQNSTPEVTDGTPTKKVKGYKTVEDYPEDIPDEEIFAGDADRIRYGTLIRLAKKYSVGQIANQINSHHPKALTAQTVSDRLQSAYKFIAGRTQRTVADVKAEVEDARRDNGLVANGRKTMRAI